MKKYTTILFLVLGSLVVLAQSKQTKLADKLFDSHDYLKASEAYLSLVDKGISDAYIFARLGTCFYKIKHTIEAEKYYEKGLALKKDSETYYNYAQVLKYNGKYATANMQMELFSNLSPNDKRAVAFRKDPDYYIKLERSRPVFEVNSIAVSAGNASFGGIAYNDTLYFASAKNVDGKLDGYNGEPFLDLYQAAFNKSNNSYSEPTAIAELNSRYHEGPLTMTKDGNSIYFSSESFNEKVFNFDKDKKLKFGQINLYKAVKKNNKWVNIEPLPFSNKSYSSGNPSIDKTGKILYFSSDMPGSIGGTDIWQVTVKSDGTYGVPENLGEKVNTVDDENFPFIADDNMLYFSSNRYTGVGGFDVYSVNLDKNEEAVNLGSPINSAKDDFSFSINKESKTGYMSSNRSGIDAIYGATSLCSREILTLIKNNKTQDLIVGAKVLIMDENKNIVSTGFSNDKGEVLYYAECKKQYFIEVYKDGYVTKAFPVSPSDYALLTVNALLEPLDIVVTATEVILNPIYFDDNKSDITAKGAEELDKLVYVMSQNNEIKIFVKSHTDSRGKDDYNLRLSTNRSRATVDYILSKGIALERVSGQGFGEAEPKVACGDRCTEEQHALNRRSEFMIVN
jgi:outer membrane protein OmpA-like peptidoglycan-associated protein/tetratricopeptide (TPR) repeat protein